MGCPAFCVNAKLFRPYSKFWVIKMKKTLLILNGDIGSTTLLYDYNYRLDLNRILDGESVPFKAIIFNNGHLGSKSFECAVKACAELDVSYELLDIRPITNFIDVEFIGNVPRGTIVPPIAPLSGPHPYNIIMWSIAIEYADKLEFDRIVVANHQNDHVICPTLNAEFVTLLSCAAQKGTNNKIEIWAPYMHLSTTKIIERGLKIGIDYENDTWSCCMSDDYPCMACSGCRARNMYLEEAKFNFNPHKPH